MCDKVPVDFPSQGEAVKKNQNGMGLQSWRVWLAAAIGHANLIGLDDFEDFLLMRVFGEIRQGSDILGLTQQRDEKSHRILSNVLKCLSNRQILTSRFLPIFLVEKRECELSEFFNKNKEVCKSLCYLTPICWVRPSSQKE